MSPVCTDLLPPPKRISDSDSVTDIKGSLEDDYEPYTELDIDPETTAEEEVESGARCIVEVEVDSRVRPVVEDDVRELVREDVPAYVMVDRVVEGHRILRVDLESDVMLERISVLEQDNTRLRGTLGVENEVDKVEKFIGGLPDNIQGNVIAAEPIRLQDAIRIANNLMDQKMKGYARSAENTRKFENRQRDNRRLQKPFKSKTLLGKICQEHIRLGIMKERHMLDPYPTTTSASCTMKGRAR
ncbi:hypothetical protein Tco_0138384 [Tanacetum coccineum]